MGDDEDHTGARGGRTGFACADLFRGWISSAIRCVSKRPPAFPLVWGGGRSLGEVLARPQKGPFRSGAGQPCCAPVPTPGAWLAGTRTSVLVRQARPSWPCFSPPPAPVTVDQRLSPFLDQGLAAPDQSACSLKVPHPLRCCALKSSLTVVLLP